MRGPSLPRRRSLLAALAALAGAPGAGATTAPPASRLPRLLLAGPFASVSNPLIRMAESGALADLAEGVEFVPWRDPDQLRVMALEGKADVLAMPVNVAANLYNRGAKLRLLNVSTWGLLWVVSRDPSVRRLADLRGREIAMPFRGDMPDILFGLVAEREGIDLRKDLRLRYVASPIDAMQLLITRRVENALLAGPAAFSYVMANSAWHTFADLIHVVIPILIVRIASWITFYIACQAEKKIRQSTLDVVQRVGGFILAAIAVEMMANGLRGLFPMLGQT